MEGDDGDKRYMGQNDPYQDLKVAMKAEIKPDFSGDSKTSDRANKISGGKSSKANETKQRAMANALQNAESAAGQAGSTSNLDAKSGELVWEYDTGEQIVSSPAAIRGYLFVLTTKGTLFCFGKKKDK